MIFRRSLPERIRGRLEYLGVSTDQVLLSLATDINAAGEYDEQWLIVTNSRLFVFDPSHGEDPMTQLPLPEISEFRTIAAVGSGLLQIRVEGVWLDLMRFSNRLKYDFDHIVKRLWQIKDGEVPPAEENLQDPQRCPNCGLMLEFPGELCPRCISRGRAVARVAKMMKPYWVSAAVMIGFLLLGTALDMAWPLLTKYLVDYVLSSPQKQHQPYAFLVGIPLRRLLIYVVGALATVQVLRAVVNVVTGRIASSVGNAMTYDVRGRLVRKLEEAGLAYYSKQETGSLVGRIAYDTDAIQGFMGQVTSGFFTQFLLVVVSFAMMVSLQPRLALWAALPAPFVLGGALVYWRYVHPRFERYWDRSSKQAGLLNGILTGIRMVKAFAQEENEYHRFQRASLDVRDSRVTLDRSAAYFYPLMAVFFQVGGWLIWYIGGGHVLDGRVSLGTLMAFFGYLSLFYGPLGSLTNLTTWLTQFSTQMHRIFEILDTPTVLPMAENPETMTSRKGAVEFKHVTFGYSRGVPVLKDLSLKIAPGERIGIVGRSGSGKTSLINLICRFYDADEGEILIDGVEIRKIAKQDLRSRIRVVLQEPFLFRGTLAENIRYGVPGADMESIVEASRSASAHDFIMRHPLGYDSSVGERGQELSEGERQRVSIARALLCSPPILILDEATSAIDSESELLIQKALEKAGHGRTMIIIAHRLSTLQDCDRIYVIENGQIVESGPHRELWAQSGRYARWVRIQQGKTYVELDSRMDVASDTFETNWLSPERDRIERGRRRELQVVSGDTVYRGVFALRCFPVHGPDRCISIRYINAENRVQEIGLIRELRDWPKAAQELIRESLARRYFFHTIERIHSIRRFSQFLAMSASTDQGKVEFIMRANQDSAQAYGHRGKLLMDVEDNLYVIPDVSGLGRDESQLFSRHVYW